MHSFSSSSFSPSLILFFPFFWEEKDEESKDEDGELKDEDGESKDEDGESKDEDGRKK